MIILWVVATLAISAACVLVERRAQDRRILNRRAAIREIIDTAPSSIAYLDRTTDKILSEVKGSSEYTKGE